MFSDDFPLTLVTCRELPNAENLVSQDLGYIALHCFFFNQILLRYTTNDRRKLTTVKGRILFNADCNKQVFPPKP